MKTSDAPEPNGGIVMRHERPGHTEFKPRKVSEIQAVRKMTSSFCGTAHYIAPESLGECKYSFASDLFSLGCVVYHMLAGRPLFNGASSFFVMKDIKAGAAAKTFAAAVARYPEAEAFIRALLHPDPVCRLGVEAYGDDDVSYRFDVDALRQHPFLAGVDWDSVTYPAAVVRDPPLSAAPASQRRPPFPRYIDTPFHTDEYAAYVYQAGDSAFERFAEATADLGAAKREPTPPPIKYDDEGGDDDTDDEEGHRRGGGAAAAEAGASSDDEVISIEDDVGVAASSHPAAGFTFREPTADDTSEA